MTVTATYVNANGKVSVAVSGAPAAATTTLIERTSDGVTWSAVRGAQALALASGACSVDDYEYADGVVNTYRASYVSPSVIAFLSAAAASTGNNTSLTPALPGSLLPGDLMLCLASIRNSGTGTPNTPAGWTKLVDASNMVLFGRRFVTGDTAPTVSFAGGAAGTDTIAQISAFRNAELVPNTSATLLNTSAQNITTPAISWPITNAMIVQLAWKQAISTGDSMAGWGTIGATSASAGSGSTDFWALALGGPPGSLTTNTVVVSGGSAQISRGAVAVLQQAAYIIQETVTVTPAQTSVWLKNPLKPYLNRAVSVQGVDDVVRAARTGVFDILSRSLPVAVTDLQGGRVTAIHVRSDSSVSDDLEGCLATGDVILIHPPAVQRVVPRMYAVLGQTGRNRPADTGTARILTLPVTEVAQPSMTLAASLSNWNTVINTYATWAALAAAKATWNDVLLLVGSPTDVVTS
jgi:hypothetical protein